MSVYKVGYFVGSLSKHSINRKLARALVRLAPENLQMVEIPFAVLPRRSEEGHRLGESSKGDKTPSRANRRRSSGRLRGKIGTAIAQTHLRSILAFCNSPLMNAIEAYIPFEPGLITDEGEVTNGSTEKFLQGFMTEMAAFIARVYTVLPRTA